MANVMAMADVMNNANPMMGQKSQAKTHKKRRRNKRRKSKRHKKSGPMPTISKKKKEDTGGPVDEKGNPFPIENPQGGDPICQGGYKIDYDFDPFNDPINPPFRCISSLKDPNDAKQNITTGMSNKLRTDEETIRGGSTKKYKHRSSYSKTRRHRDRRRH